MGRVEERETALNHPLCVWGYAILLTLGAIWASTSLFPPLFVLLLYIPPVYLAFLYGAHIWLFWGAIVLIAVGIAVRWAAGRVTPR